MTEPTDTTPALPSLDAQLDALSISANDLLLIHRSQMKSRLRAARERLRTGQPVDKIIADLTRLADDSSDVVRKRSSTSLSFVYPHDLPISQRRQDIAKAVAENQVVVICGETGSGKTTQLPKICLELGRGIHGAIGHTQPRRIAARSVAQRLAEELQTPLGQGVGYKVRFADRTSPASRVRLMTDGILLAETQSDPNLLAYDTIIIDEAHERSLNIDFLLGYLKQLLPKRPDLKLIITSATIDPARFGRHFDDAPVVMVEGRSYPVAVRYEPPPTMEEREGGEELAPTLGEWVVETTRRAMSDMPGDVLVFLPGEREIRDCTDAFRGATDLALEVVPLFARLSVEEQMRVFKPHGKRRVVLSTNVAETSLTVPGIRIVIDTGVARVSRYSPRQKIQRLPIERTSQASANQRKGRCGRIASGLCVRLYSEEDFSQRSEFTDPEILRTNLASVILQMKAYGLGRIEEFPFLDPPDFRQVKDGYQTLFELGALDENNEMTRLGKLLARMPTDPKLGRMIVAASESDCLREVLIIAAGLSVQDPRERPMDKQSLADSAHAKFREAASDFFVLLNLWRAYEEQDRTLSQSKMRKWCTQNFVSYTRMREWQDVQSQLRELAGELDWYLNREPAEPERVHRAVLCGLLSNVGTKAQDQKTSPGAYKAVRGREFFLFPGSSMFHRKPAWVMCGELVETTKLYARSIAEIDPTWIEDAAAHLVQRSYTDPQWQRATGRVVAHEKVTLHGLAIVPRRTVNFAPIDPKTSRELFIFSALAEQDFDCGGYFFKHNAKLIREIELLEARTRRRDLLVDVRSRYAYYDAKIPADVVDARSFERWRNKAEGQNKHVLFMTREDLLMRSTDDVGAEQFPSTIECGGVKYPLDYHFDPAHPADGVSLTLKLAQLNTIDADRLDWLVPGLVEEKIEDLIRTLDKPKRVRLVPAPDFARRASRLVSFADGNFFHAVAGALGKLSGDKITADDFRPADVQTFLKMNIRVVDDANKPVAHGRDIGELRKQLREKLRQLFASETNPTWHRDDLKTWDFGDLPPRIELKRAGGTVQAFPALVDQGKAAGLRLVETGDLARENTRRGVRRLFVIEYEKELRWHVSDMPLIQEMRLWYSPLGNSDQLRDLLIESLADRLITPDAADVRTRVEYELQLRGAWNRLTSESRIVRNIATETLRQFHDASLRLGKAAPPSMSDGVRDMRLQLFALVPANFLIAVSKSWIEHVPRFVKGINVRFAKMTNAGLKRDLDVMKELSPRVLRLTQLLAKWPRGEVLAAEVVRYRWLVEELRVSQFAQELGTSETVSIKRIDGLWEEIEKKFL